MRMTLVDKIPQLNVTASIDTFSEVVFANLVGAYSQTKGVLFIQQSNPCYVWFPKVITEREDYHEENVGEIRKEKITEKVEVGDSFVIRQSNSSVDSLDNEVYIKVNVTGLR